MEFGATPVLRVLGLTYCGGREPKVSVAYTAVRGGSLGAASPIRNILPYFSTGENSSGVYLIGIFKTIHIRCYALPTRDACLPFVSTL